MRLPLRSVTTVALIATVGFAGCGDDDIGSGGSAAAADPERYCELSAESSSTDDFEVALEAVREAVEVAPDEIRDDVEVLAAATEDNAELLEKMVNDPESLSDSEMEDLEEVFSSEDFTAADERVVAWEADNCAGADADAAPDEDAAEEAAASEE